MARAYSGMLRWIASMISSVRLGSSARIAAGSVRGIPSITGAEVAVRPAAFGIEIHFLVSAHGTGLPPCRLAFPDRTILLSQQLRSFFPNVPWPCDVSP